MAARKPIVLLPHKYKTVAAAQKASQAMSNKLGVTVGAQLAKGVKLRPAGKKKVSAKRTKRANPKGGVRRTKTGQFKKGTRPPPKRRARKA